MSTPKSERDNVTILRDVVEAMRLNVELYAEGMDPDEAKEATLRASKKLGHDEEAAALINMIATLGLLTIVEFLRSPVEVAATFSTDDDKMEWV